MKRKLVMLATAMMILALAAPAGADLIEFTSFQNVSSSSPTAAFTITPFDTTMGTLNSVTMGVIVHIDGAAQLWTWGEFSTITYNATNTLDAVPEMGWGATIATLAGFQTHENRNYDSDESFEGQWPNLIGTQGSAGDTTITSNFDRFIGATSFDIGLTLAGLASSTYQDPLNPPLDYNGNPIINYNTGDPGLDTVIFGYDGTAQLWYDYNYTPTAVPEPATMLLFGFGLVGLAGLRRFKK